MYTNLPRKVAVGGHPCRSSDNSCGGKGIVREIGTPREGGDGGRLGVCLFSFGVWVVVLKYIGF